MYICISYLLYEHLLPFLFKTCIILLVFHALKKSATEYVFTASSKKDCIPVEHTYFLKNPFSEYVFATYSKLIFAAWEMLPKLRTIQLRCEFTIRKSNFTPVQNYVTPKLRQISFRCGELI
uniref:Uncharacterized protein n=1 Tax=Megaselia scalaris TaxID=36166 RepID=T1GI22_MEGSC